MGRVLHIGIDAGALDVLDRFAELGVMPVFGELRARAGRGILRSTEPWFTVPGWVTWMTGVPARRHGLTSWTIARPRDHWTGVRDRLVVSTDIRFPTVFELASAAGRSVASLNMPVTFPPARVNGVMVSGFPAPLDPSRVSHPEAFLDRYPDYRVDVEVRPGPTGGRMRDDVVRDYGTRLTSMTRERARVASDLLGSGTELVSVVFVGPDRLLHVAGPAIPRALDGEDGGPAGVVAAYYAELDRAIGLLVEAAGDRLVLLTSDHGQTVGPRRVFSVNAWLERGGWLVSRSRVLARAARALPAGVRRSAWWALRQRRERPLHAPPMIDWERTRAYGIVYPHCQLFGIVLREPDERLLRRVERDLLDLRDAESGDRVVERTVRGTDWLEPDVAVGGPDVVAFLRPGWGTASGVGGPVFAADAGAASGEHTRDGMVVATGGAAAAGDHAPSDISQVAATILSALEVSPGAEPAPPIDWIVGKRAAEERPGAAPADAPPDTRDPGLSTREEDEIVRQLEHLGYL